MRIIKAVLKRVLNTRKLSLFVICNGRLITKENIRVQRGVPLVAYFSALAKHEGVNRPVLCESKINNGDFYASVKTGVFADEFRRIEVNLDVGKRTRVIQVLLDAEEDLILHCPVILVKKGREKEHKNVTAGANEDA